jgi:hypothetical protein
LKITTDWDREREPVGAALDPWGIGFLPFGVSKRKQSIWS